LAHQITGVAREVFAREQPLLRRQRYGSW
jgi:hypothetical protein